MINQMAAIFQWSDFASFQAVSHWVLGHGYWVIFIAMLIEGPIVIAAAGFAAALGYFNVYTIFGLSLLTELVADVGYYALGYWGRMALVERFGGRIGLTKQRLERMADLLHRHAWKTLLALKLTPVIPTTGLMLVGVTRMPLKKYITICAVIILPKTIAFEVIGYFFGTQYNILEHYVNNISYLILAVIVLVVLFRYVWEKYSTRLAKKIEKL